MYLDLDKEIVCIEYQMAVEKSRLLQLSTKSSRKLSFKFSLISYSHINFAIQTIHKLVDMSVLIYTRFD